MKRRTLQPSRRVTVCEGVDADSNHAGRDDFLPPNGGGRVAAASSRSCTHREQALDLRRTTPAQLAVRL